MSTLRIDGIVHAPNGMIAVVSNPQQRTYFLHEGDQLYDGRVDKIAMDGMSFHESGKDAFGKPVEREVNKRIYSNAGDRAMKTNWPALRTGFLILASLAVGTTAWPAQTQELAGATTTPAVISSVAILQNAMQRASVRVEGEGKLEARAARMQNPERLVLDFTGAGLGAQKTAIPGVQAPVLGVRLGQFRSQRGASGDRSYGSDSLPAVA